MLFRLHVYRFTFVARAPLFFPYGKAGNVLRGALGTCFRELVCQPACAEPAQCPTADCPYARLFAPRQLDGPSGLIDAPRPFVLRASHLDGRHFKAGETFTLDTHVFDLTAPVVQYFALAFTRLLEEGLGPGRGSVELQRIEAAGEVLFADGRFCRADHPAPTVCELTAAQEASRIRIELLTPTEIKADGEVVRVPAFAALFARVRDRISNLRALYGEGPLEVDFRAQAERAGSVSVAASEIRDETVERRSSRTGQRHPIGGVVGWVEYVGDLREFLPYLQAGEYTGVGRQTVWGKGSYRVHVLS